MGTWLDKVLKKHKKEQAVYLQTKQQNLQQQRQRMPFKTGQEPFQLQNEPLKAAHETPAHKGKKTLGNLSKSERQNTHSDVQRTAFKQNLLDNVKMDGKETFGKSFSQILKLIKQYAQIDAVGDSHRDLINQEQQLLEQINQQISDRLEQLATKLQDGQISEDEAAQIKREQKILSLYANYFALDTSGYLTIPAQGTPNTVFIDCSQMQMKGTYDAFVDGVITDLPITMRDVSKNTPLFSHEPSLNDVAQGCVGDCYLLAALSAVISRNPQWIKDCMKDHGDGTVTVRFYNKEVHDNQTSFQANYVKIKKAIPEGDPYAKNSLWVQLIEHAYAAYLSNKKQRASGIENPNEGNYRNIEGGTPELFMEVILGKKVEHTVLGNVPSANMSQVFAKLESINTSAQIAEQGRTGGINYSQIMAKLFNITPPDTNDPKFVDYLTAMSQLRIDYMNYFSSIKDVMTTVEDAHRVFAKIRPESFPDLPKELGLTDRQQLGIKRQLLKNMKMIWLDTKVTSLPHEAFSGKYRQKELLIYEQIRQAMLEGKMMVASTHNQFLTSTNTAGMNGESVEDGIASGHAYTVLGVKQIGQTKYIKMRNPWAIGTREYTQDENTGSITRTRKDADTHGIFLIELNEFARYYEKVGIV